MKKSTQVHSYPDGKTVPKQQLKKLTRVQKVSLKKTQIKKVRQRGKKESDMPVRTVETKFYDFNQNNSGGSFDHDATRGIGHHVIVEATSAQDAVSRAESIGLYFDGSGDCSCCGNRWSEPYGEGDDVPKIYDQDVSGGTYLSEWGGWGIPSYIHYINGVITEVKEEKMSPAQKAQAKAKRDAEHAAFMAEREAKPKQLKAEN